MSVYCKYTKCEWNRWDEQNLKHRCNKAIRHLDKRGRCEIGDFARPVGHQSEESSETEVIGGLAVMSDKKWAIGERAIDEDGNDGVVAIVWNDGDICTIENDAAHPNPEPKKV